MFVRAPSRKNELGPFSRRPSRRLRSSAVQHQLRRLERRLRSAHCCGRLQPLGRGRPKPGAIRYGELPDVHGGAVAAVVGVLQRGPALVVQSREHVGLAAAVSCKRSAAAAAPPPGAAQADEHALHRFTPRCLEGSLLVAANLVAIRAGEHEALHADRVPFVDRAVQWPISVQPVLISGIVAEFLIGFSVPTSVFLA